MFVDARCQSGEYETTSKIFTFAMNNYVTVNTQRMNKWHYLYLTWGYKSSASVNLCFTFHLMMFNVHAVSLYFENISKQTAFYFVVSVSSAPRTPPDDDLASRKVKNISQQVINSLMRTNPRAAFPVAMATAAILHTHTHTHTGWCQRWIYIALPRWCWQMSVFSRAAY